MPGTSTPTVAIVDYGLGNLFSVEQACRHAGIDAVISSDAQQIRDAQAVILPGVGAFASAMARLNELELADELRTYAATNRPLIGICLGMQLLMEESYEFGVHRGLGLVPGTVRRLRPNPEAGRFKVPQVGWNTLSVHPDPAVRSASLLKEFADGTFIYFVHSFCVEVGPGVTPLATSEYGGEKFCAAYSYGHITGIQGHPERSGSDGLRFYENLAAILRDR